MGDVSNGPDQDDPAGDWRPPALPQQPPAPPPVPPQVPSAPPARPYAPPRLPRPQRLASEQVVVQAPFSFSGSARRLWRPVKNTANPAAKAAVGTLMVVLIATAWIFIACWYLFFGIFLVPFRLIRRGGRKRKQDDRRHREMVAAMQAQQQWPPPTA